MRHQPFAARTTAVSDDDLRGLEVPLLAIYGEHSDVLDTGRDLAALVPGAHFELLDDQDHSLLLRCADRLNELLVPWVLAHATAATRVGVA